MFLTCYKFHRILCILNDAKGNLQHPGNDEYNTRECTAPIANVTFRTFNQNWTKSAT